jgi:hypothetical protein
MKKANIEILQSLLILSYPIVLIGFLSGVFPVRFWALLFVGLPVLYVWGEIKKKYL